MITLYRTGGGTTQNLNALRSDAEPLALPFVVGFGELEFVNTATRGLRPILSRVQTVSGTIGAGPVTLVGPPLFTAAGAAEGQVMRHDVRDISIDNPNAAQAVLQVRFEDTLPSIVVVVANLAIPAGGVARLEGGERWTIYDATGAVVSEGGGGTTPTPTTTLPASQFAGFF